MWRRVDLPDPGWAHHGHHVSLLHLDRGALQGVDVVVLAHHVALVDVLSFYDDRHEIVLHLFHSYRSAATGFIREACSDG